MRFWANLKGGSRTGGIRADGGSAAKAGRPNHGAHTGPCVHSDAIVGHAKWLINQGFNDGAVAGVTGLKPTYIRQLRDGIVRANVAPKEITCLSTSASTTDAPGSKTEPQPATPPSMDP